MNMSTITVTYSHALPWIRNKLCYAAHEAETSKTKAATVRAECRARGLAQALSVLANSQDAQVLDVGGIAEDETLPLGAMSAVARLFGSEKALRLLGIQQSELTPASEESGNAQE